MSRIYTDDIAAQMVADQPLRNWGNEQCVKNFMSTTGSNSRNAKLPVTVVGQSGQPFPARVIVMEMGDGNMDVGKYPS